MRMPCDNIAVSLTSPWRLDNVSRSYVYAGPERGHLFIRCLKQEGVEKIFTIVGDTILPVVDAAADEGIEFIDTRHEGAAMHMAAGYARITGKPAVAMFTGGPGFSNAISGLQAIYTSESPVIFVAGCAELPEKGQATFQEIDQVAMAAPVSKGSWLIHDKNRIPEYVATAFSHSDERTAGAGASDIAD